MAGSRLSGAASDDFYCWPSRMNRLRSTSAKNYRPLHPVGIAVEVVAGVGPPESVSRGDPSPHHHP